jgi:hypothetical protein
MRRDRCLVDAVAAEALGVLEARGLVGWSVVHPREQVEMQVDMGHAVVPSGGSSVSARCVRLVFATITPSRRRS